MHAPSNLIITSLAVAVPRLCSPPSIRRALTCRASFPQARACSRWPVKRLSQRSHHDVDEIDIGAARDGDRCGRAPAWRGHRIIAVGEEAFLNELERASVIRESVTSVRFPYRQSSAEPNLYGHARRSDHAAPLQAACLSCVRLRARHSFVPAKSRSAAARNIGQGPGRRALARLAPKGAGHGTCFVVGAMFECQGRSSTAGQSHTSRPTHCAAPSAVYRARENCPTPCSQTQSTRRS